MDREDVIPTYSGILLSHKNEIMPSAGMWTDLEIILSETRQTNQTSYDFSHMWNLIKKYIRTFYKKKKKSYRYQKNKLMVTKRETLGVGRGKSGAWNEHTHTYVYMR